MKPIQFLPIVMIAAAGLAASCSTSKLAQTKPVDDVYNSVAKAREVEVVLPSQNQQAQYQNNGQEEYDEYYGTSNPYYDMDYSSRINRFHNGYSFQGYYDPYFDNYYYGSSYGPSNYLGIGLGWNSGYGLGGWGGGFGYGGGWGFGSIWNNPFYYGNYGFGWNNPWAWNAWGPYSYYDRFGWGGGYYGGGWGIGGGYYGGGVYSNSNYRPRPGNTMTSRGYGNNSGNNAGRPSRSGMVNQNGVSYAPNNNAGRPTRSQANGNNGYSRPDVSGSRPGRNENYSPQPQRTESRPTYSPPPTSRGSSGGGSYGGGGSTGGGSRPSRAGRG
ncbi:hypothetical protein [Pedobacter sp. KACC 23697]|uniref:Prolyl-tRNA synthetase n=1 Tax=Pedobacter sp. KACC 23697 TaxID=3149230 RepID=A0AAU7K8X5_9SPHI